MDDNVLTAKEAAAFLRVGVATFYKLAHRADFPVVKVGKRILVSRRKLGDWLDTHAGKAVEV